MSIDGAIQSTEMDEFSYHEMMSHIVLYSHPNPQRVLIIGGGDMGVAREVLKHKCVELVDNCDIDEKVTVINHHGGRLHGSGRSPGLLRQPCL